MKKAFLALLLSFSSYAWAQENVLFDDFHWIIKGQVKREIYQGKEGIQLREGVLILRDSTFKNGIIEFDMTLTRERYFPGFGFRMQDTSSYECVYLRPHQLGNPDAMQYMPVYNGQESWQLYYGQGYTTALTYPLDQWTPIKVVVKGEQAEVYIGNKKEPDLIIHPLKREAKAGRLMLLNERSPIARYANFRVTKDDNVALHGEYKLQEDSPMGVITHWNVSNTFDEKSLGTHLSKSTLKKLQWTLVASENTGLVNLSETSKLKPGHNTVLAKLTLVSAKDQIKKLKFGFSDKVKVYVNGKLVYSGEDVFMSRDYRFLGTVGYFDAVYLDLHKGINEIYLAVTEDFGGWGVQGMMEDLRDITLNKK